MSSITSQNKEGYTVQLEIAVSADELKEAVDQVFRRRVKSITVPGFRKGKAPRSVIERMYGDAMFIEDAVNDLYPKAYQEALAETDIEPVAPADIDIVSVDKENGFTFKATVTVKPEIEVGKYKGIEATKTIYKTEDSDIDAEIARMQERNARIVTVEDRAAKDGDTAIIDFEGFLDGVPFDGGKGESHQLELGSGSFIEGFEQQIIGHKTGDEFDVEVTFPEEYHAENLKGKPAVFKVKLHEIKEKQLPEIDDEFAKDVSEFDTINELKADVRKRQEESHERRSTDEMETRLVDAVVAEVSGDIPEVMIDNKVDDMVQDFAYRLQNQGMKLDMYLQYTGMDMAAFRETFREQAERQVKMRLALETIAVKEALEASDEDVEGEYKKLSDMYNMDVDNLKKRIPEKSVKGDIVCNKAVDLIKENAKITEVAEEKAKEEAPAADVSEPVKKAASKKKTKKEAEESADSGQ